jgi:hypothetical protein
MTNQHFLLQIEKEELTCLFEYLTVDPSSPSGLTWKKKPPKGKARLGGVAGWVVNAGHYRLQLFGKRYRASHLVLLLSNVLPALGKTEVDHIDRNTQNNSLANLRWIDRSGNLANRRVMGRVAYRYVHCSRGKYTAQYTHPSTKKQVFVGRYATPVEAHHQAIAHRLEQHWIKQ